ncbi:MAG: DNA polymerase III subunit epsilon [Salaquimonas sp.]
MREIIFDTETTGFRPEEGERVIEIGAIEFENRVETGRTFHEYINPEGRQVDPGAFRVHGISNEFLNDKKPFSQIAKNFMDFVGDAILVAHNAPFDINFLNHEFARLDMPPVDPDKVVDTLEIARRKHPMAQNSLDRLCDRYNINNKHRTFHGALLDSQLLAEVYIELLGGRQTTLELVSETQTTSESNGPIVTTSIDKPIRIQPLSSRLTAAEKSSHDAFIEKMGENALWKKYQ